MKQNVLRSLDQQEDLKYEQAVVINFVSCRYCESNQHMTGHIFCKVCYLRLGGYAF